MSRPAFFALLLLSGAAGAASAYDGVKVDSSGVRTAQAFVGGILQTRVAERMTSATGTNTLAVAYVLDPSLAGERYRVMVKDGRAEVRAGRTRALIFGTGALLRRIAWADGAFAVADGVIDACPAKPFRMAYTARHFYNWYHMASTEQLVRYIEDLVLWGINSVHMQFAYPVVDLEYARPGDVERFERISHEFGAALARMDLDYIGYGGGNQAPFNTDPRLKAEPNVDPKRGNNGFNVCPAKPGGLEFLRRQQSAALARFKDVHSSWLEHWPFDEGGCACAACSPWGGNGYLSLCAALAADNAKACPGSKSLLSTWTFHDDEFARLYAYLAKPESDWIGAILVDSHGDFPKYVLEHELPRKIPIVTFPEISMWGREPWGGFGAVAMPSRFERLFRQCEKVVSGFQFYSEGLAEDLNKVVVTQLYCEPSRSWREIVRDYCRYEFPGVDPERFVTLVTHLENTQVLPNFDAKSNVMPNVGRGDVPHFDDFEARCRYCLDEARKGEALSAELERSLSSGRRNSWRWRQIRLRTVIDREIFTARSWHTPTSDAAYRELVKIYNADRTYGCIQPPINR